MQDTKQFGEISLEKLPQLAWSDTKIAEQNNIFPKNTKTNWEKMMQTALFLAKKAELAGEIPVGALVLDLQGNILGEGKNACITTGDPTAHAEILALRQAAQVRKNYRLPETIMVCTLEPCLMCLGAMLNARIAGLIFAASDTKAGAIVSKMDGAELTWVNHHFWFARGLLAEQSTEMLRTFFKQRRKER